MSDEIQITPMTEEMLAQMIVEDAMLNPERPIRQDIIDSLARWVERGIEPGGFLLSVLSNDLFEAMGRADSYNRATISQICSYIYNDLPNGCWGSPERVAAWKGLGGPNETD